MLGALYLSIIMLNALGLSFRLETGFFLQNLQLQSWKAKISANPPTPIPPMCQYKMVFLQTLDKISLFYCSHAIKPTLLISIGKLTPTIGMITYRNTCALDSKGKIAYKLILNLLPVIFLGKCSSNSNYFGI